MAKVCGGCGEELTGAYLTAEDKTWHQECFKCDMCGEALAKGGGIAYAKTPDGKRVCGDCKTTMEAGGGAPAPRKCEKCGKDTTGQMMVSPDGKKICADCAPTGPCGKCGEQVTFEHLTSGAMIATDGKVYHKECWTGTVTKTMEEAEKVISENECRGCKKPISGKTVIGHMEDKFHEDCFRCASCGDLLADSFTVNPDRKFKYQEARYLHEECARKEDEAAASGEAAAAAAAPAADGAMRVSMAGGGNPGHLVAGSGQGKPCDVCGESLSDGRAAITFPDGKGLHSECFKCCACGEAINLEDPAVKRLLRAKVKQCIEGTLKCEKCAPAQEAMAPPTVDLAQAKLDAEKRHEELEVQKAEAARAKEEREKAKTEKEAADKAAAAEAEVAKKAAEDAASSEAAAALEAHGSFTLEQLKDASYWKPKGVSEKERETYLADDEFQKLFGVDKEAFAKLAKWKKDSEKKKHGLF